MQSKVIGNFKIINKIGEGGMGDVYKGMDTMLEREVAIKSLKPELTSRDDIVTRFKTEAIALARLNHPNIATLYSFFRHDDQFFMVMEFVKGDTLAEYIKRRGTISLHDSIAIVRQALDGLEHAHASGIIHKDIKPANMMLTTTNVIKLMDFGIARILEKARLTQTGYLIGTLKYMSPEQVRGIDVTAQTDIYALGVVLYELITRRVPFESDSDYELIKAKVEEKTPPPRTFNPKVPKALESVILKALEKDLGKRYGSAREFSQALQNAALELPSLDLQGDDATVVIPMVANQAAKVSEAKTVVSQDNSMTSMFGGNPRRNIIALLVFTTLTGLASAGYFQWDSSNTGAEIENREEPGSQVSTHMDKDTKTEVDSLIDPQINEKSSQAPKKPALSKVNTSIRKAPAPKSEPKRTSTLKTHAAIKTSKTPKPVIPAKPKTHYAQPTQPKKAPQPAPPKTITPLEGWAIEK